MSFTEEILRVPSQRLAESRSLFVFLPEQVGTPETKYLLLCADGQMLERFVTGLASDTRRQVLCVGIESNPATRDYDYVHGLSCGELS